MKHNIRLTYKHSRSHAKYIHIAQTTHTAFACIGYMYTSRAHILTHTHMHLQEFSSYHALVIPL